VIQVSLTAMKQYEQDHHFVAELATMPAATINRTVIYTVFRKKTPTHVFFYISFENVSICAQFSGYVWEELGIPSKLKLNIHCYCWLANILPNVYLLP